MEAARLLRVRGHDVDLYEKRTLGGTMNEAAFDLTFKHDISRLIDYYKVQMEKLAVHVIPEEATAEKVLAGHYDAVIVATGAPALPARVKGVDQYGSKVMSMFDFATHANTAQLGDTVLIVGGCFMNLEAAYSLACKGKKVILSPRRGKVQGIMELGTDNSSPQQQRLSVLLSGMRDKVSFRLGHSIAEVTADGAVLINSKTKDRVEVKCDNIILCRGYHGQPAIYEQLRTELPEVYLVGDAVLRSRCDNKRVIGDAITDAWGIANNI